MTRTAGLRGVWQDLFKGARHEHGTLPTEISARDLLEEVTLALQSIQNEIDSSVRAEVAHESVALNWLDVCQQSDHVNDLLEQLVGGWPPSNRRRGGGPTTPAAAHSICRRRLGKRHVNTRRACTALRKHEGVSEKPHVNTRRLTTSLA